MMSYKFARRSFLRGAGGLAPLMLPLLRSIEARAAGAAAPLRLLVIQHPLGTNPGLDELGPERQRDDDQLHPSVRERAVHPASEVHGHGRRPEPDRASGAGPASIAARTPPEGGMVALMTGVPTIGMVGQQDHCAGGPSIDQILLQRSPTLGGPNSGSPTPFGSLQLAADVRSDRDEVSPRVLSYLAPKTGVSDPSARTAAALPGDVTAQRLHPPLRRRVASASGNAGAGLLAHDLSALNYMRRDLARLRSLAPASEKGKLDAYAAAITQLEASLRAKYGNTGGACVTPAVPPSFPATSTGKQGVGVVYTDLPGVDYYVAGQPASHPHLDLGQTQLRLIKAAFACDLARVATFMWASGTSWVQFPGTFQGATVPGNPTSAPHHAVAQSGDAADAGLAESDRPVLLGGDVDGAARVRDDAGHRRQHADRQHHHRLRDRGGAGLRFESAEHAGHRVRWKEHPG